MSNSGAAAILSRFVANGVAIIDGSGERVINIPVGGDGDAGPAEAGYNAAFAGAVGRWRQTGVAIPAGDFYIELAYNGVWQMQQRVNRARLAGLGNVIVGQDSGSYMQLPDVDNQSFYVSRDSDDNLVVASSPGAETMGILGNSMRIPFIGKRADIEAPQVDMRANYGDSITELLLRSLLGQDAAAIQSGAAEYSIALISRCLSVAELSPEIPAVTPAFLADAARRMMSSGNAVYAIRVQDGEVMLLPSSGYDIMGPASPAQLDLPSGNSGA